MRWTGERLLLLLVPGLLTLLFFPVIAGFLARYLQSYAWPSFFIALGASIALSLTLEALFNERRQNQLRGRHRPEEITIDEFKPLIEDTPGVPTEPVNEGVLFGGKIHPPDIANTNFLFLGAIGSGKTTSILMLMKSVLPAIGKGLRRRALVYDAKTEFIPYLDSMVPGRWFTFNPFDTRCVAWDMAKDINDPASALELAEILIQTSGQETSPFFPKAARHIVRDVTLALIILSPGKWKFWDLVYILKSGDRIKDVLARTDETKDTINLYFSNERTSNDILATIATEMLAYELIAANWKHAEEERPPVSLNDWIRKEQVLVLGASERSRVAVDAVNQLIFTRASQLLLDLPDRDPEASPALDQSWIFLDEVRHAGKLHKLHAIMTKGRSKGVCTVLGLQDIDGLRALYDKEIADEIAGQCSNKVSDKLWTPSATWRKVI